MKDKLNKINWRKLSLNYLIPFATITAVMFIMSGISPLYQHTYQIIDFGATSSVAKAIGHGQVYMRDVFEQRGIYLYFIHIFTAFMPFYWAKFCIWILEVVNMCGFYLLLRHIGIKFVQNRPGTNKELYFSKWALIITVLLTLTSAFGNSASPEEWCIIPVLYSIYLLYQFNDSGSISLRQSFIGGLLIGYVTNIKYSIIMALAGFFLFYGFYLLFTKQGIKFLKTAGIAILGYAIAFLPAIIYFTANNALGIYFKSYFIDNASSLNINVIFTGTLHYLSLFVLFIILFCANMVMAIGSLKNITKLGFTVIFISTILGTTLIGRTGIAYPLPIYVILLTLAGLGAPRVYNFYHPKTKSAKLDARITICLQTLITLMAVGQSLIDQSFINSTLRLPNVNYYKENNQTYPNLQASQMIGKFGGGKVLSYGTITDDIYMYNDEYPKLKYFDQTTMDYNRFNKSVKAQNEYIKNKKPVWVEYKNIIPRRPKGMSLAEYRKDTKDYNYEYKASRSLKPAQVTANSDDVKKHPKNYVIAKKQTLRQNGNYYYLQAVYSKDLLKNYDLVYLGFSQKDDTSVGYPTIGESQWLWVRKSYVKTHPKLNDYIIDPMHIEPTLNDKNSFINYDK